MVPPQPAYYQGSFASNTPPPLPVPYPHHALSELAAAAATAVASTTAAAAHAPAAHHQPHRPPEPLVEQQQPESSGSQPYAAAAAYDYHHALHALHTPVDEIPIPSDDQTPVYPDPHPSYEYDKSVVVAAATAANSVTSSALEQLQQLQQLQEQQQQLEQEQLQQQQQLEQQPVCSAKELSAAIAAVAAADITKLKLPPKWKAARDAEGRIYYYHTKTRVSQWYPPQWEPAAAAEVEQVEEGDYSSEDESSADDEDEQVEAKKRRRSGKYENVFSKRLHREGGDKDAEQNSFDVSDRGTVSGGRSRSLIASRKKRSGGSKGGPRVCAPPPLRPQDT